MILSTELSQKIERTQALLQDACTAHKPVVLANSLGAEDMVLTDIICRNTLGIDIFTLDTGRLHEETYRLLDEIKKKYGLLVKVYYPEVAAVEQYVQERGINAFYDSVELRKACCQIRKVGPLKRALLGKNAWITGLRREQSVTRDELKPSEWDDDFQLYKFNPLYDWSEQDTWDYIRRYNVPYNLLHDAHFPSIGCAPCTRAVEEGEDVRAGRWWWESPSNKECGLHRSARQEVQA
ncbi:MAG: phosphoadenylyl-sulfate reductase [Gammaproteobacteria bacterium]|nr:phosphoadenylyl-sulfate reductase [Gammaproteobacteria bacterium]